MSSEKNKRFLAWKNKWSDPNEMDEFEYYGSIVRFFQQEQ